MHSSLASVLLAFALAIGAMSVVGMNTSSGSEIEAATHQIKTATDFERVMRDRFVTHHDDGPGLRLARSWLVATEEGFTSKRRISLSDTTRVRKVFDLPYAGVTGADLYMLRGGGTADNPMKIEVNGHSLEHAEPGMADRRGWRRQSIPGDWLQQGPNTLVLSGNGQIVDDVRSATVGSAVTYDGGRNWHPAEGEFVMRLRVHGYAPKGKVTSPVIDAGPILAPDQPIGPWPKASAMRIDIAVDEPSGTEVKVMWRAGSTPQFDPRSWTAWQSGAEAEAINARYVQWRLTLRTIDPSRTPVVHSVTTSLRPDDFVGPPAWLDRVSVDSDDQPEISESSYPFEYETDSPRIRHLRETTALASLLDSHSTGQSTASPADDLEATTTIRHWVSRQWKDGWNSGKYRYVPPWDALILLEMAPENLSLGMCTHYATVYVQASIALGYVSRHVIVDRHALAETFLNDRDQWVLQDAGPRAGPDGYPVGVRFEKNGEPINALHMHHAHIRARPGISAIPHPDEGEPRDLDPDGNDVSLYRRFGIPLRNNHLSVPEPAEQEHGSDSYRYDGYLWWSNDLDNPFENVAYFSLLSNRPADFYPTLNATRVDLEAADEEGVVRVNLWSTMPNIETYEISIDDIGWQRVSPPFDWPLEAGKHTIEARAVNSFGRAGPASSVTISN